MASAATVIRRTGRVVGGAVGLGVLGGSIAGTYFYVTEPGVQRGVRFWAQVGPIVGHYAWHRFCAKGDEDRRARYQLLHVQHAPDARCVIEELRGMFIKVAQVMSVRPEIVPAEYRDEFRKLQDGAPPVRWDAVQTALETDLGAPIHTMFDRIDEVPLGAASIGQAHLVEWHGRPAVVKVRYPDAVSMFYADFRCLEALLWLLGETSALAILQQLRDQFAQELNYEKEALNLRQLHNAINAAPEFRERVVVPEPLLELTKGNVVGMEYLPGTKLESVLRKRLEILGVQMNGISFKDWLKLQQPDMAANSQAPLPSGRGEGPAANCRVEQSDHTSRLGKLFHLGVRLLGIDFLLWLAGAVADLRLRLKSGSCRAKDDKSVETMTTAELRELLHTVLSVHGYQVFFCPLFNGDPHPGNILLLPDGRVGLIDFGQCRQLSHEQRLAIANLFVALSDSPDTPNQDARIAAAFAATGIKTKNSNERFLAMMPRLMFCGLKPEWLDRARLKEIFENDKLETFPTHMIMLYRASMLLRGTCLVLQENVNIAEAWRPWAERWIHEHASQ